MKIVAVVPQSAARSRVGAFIATHEHLRTLKSRGHDVLILTTMSEETFRVDGMTVSGLGWGATDRLRDADVCISHAGDTVGRASEAARAAGVPHVVLVHGAPPPCEPDADMIVANSEATAAELQHYRAPVIVAHPHTRFKDHHGPTGQFTTLVNLSGPKGGRVFRRTAARCRDLPFLGVRGGYGGQVVIPVTDHNVATINPVADMRHVWSQTRILMMPSEVETWGMVGVEAMCSGIPVIAHPTPGLRESLGDAGIFVDRDDVDGWVQQVRRLQSPDWYAQASKKALARARELCDGTGTRRFADAVEALVGVEVVA